MTTLALARQTIRGSTWLSRDGFRELLRRQKAWVLVLACFGVAVGAGVVLLFLINTYAGLIVLGSATGHPELALFYGLLGSWLFLFFTGIPVALSLLAYAKDIQLLRSMPLRPSQIVGAKALLLYLYSLPTSWLFLLPAVVLSAKPLGLTPSFIVASLVHLFVSPLLPVALGVFVVLALMRLVDLSRFRTALEVVGMLFGIALIIGFQSLMSRTTMAAMGGGGAVTALNQLPNIYGALARALPPVAWGSSAFVAGGWGFLGLSAAVTVACGALAWVASPLSFLRDPGERYASRRRRASAVSIDRAVAAGGRSPLRSLMRRELSILASNSTFIFQGAAELVILPLVLGVYGLVLPRKVFTQAMAFISSGAPWIGPALLAVIVLMTILTTISSTSISREGPRFALSLVIPVSGRRQVLAKLAFHLFAFGPVFLLDCAIVLLLFRLSPLVLVYYLPAGFAFTLIGFSAGMFFELKRPLLKWSHPQQAMKNNTNGLATTGIMAAAVGVLAVPSGFAISRGIDPFVLGCIAAGIAVAAAAIVVPRMLAFADRQYGGGLEMTG